MAGGRLRYTLAIRNPDTQEVESLLQGAEVPVWARDLVHADDVEPVRRVSSAKSEG